MSNKFNKINLPNILKAFFYLAFLAFVTWHGSEKKMYEVTGFNLAEVPLPSPCGVSQSVIRKWICHLCVQLKESTWPSFEA